MLKFKTKSNSQPHDLLDFYIIFTLFSFLLDELISYIGERLFNYRHFLLLIHTYAITMTKHCNAECNNEIIWIL